MARKTIRVEFVVPPLPHEVCPECHGSLFEEHRQLRLALPLVGRGLLGSTPRLAQEFSPRRLPRPVVSDKSCSRQLTKSIM